MNSNSYFEFEFETQLLFPIWSQPEIFENVTISIRVDLASSKTRDISVTRLKTKFKNKFTPTFNSGNLIIFTDDKKNLGASDLVDKILPKFAQLSYDPIAIDLPQFGHAPPISLENSAEIKAPIAFIKQILIHLNIKSASSTVVFTGEAGHYMIPFIQDQPHFFQAILGIDPKHEIISGLDLNKKSLFQKRILQRSKMANFFEKAKGIKFFN